MSVEKTPIIVQEIDELPLRNVFAREDAQFTPWLAEKDNLERLGRALGFDLEVVATEASTGRFRTDILARRTQDGATVVIENQFGRSDHDHFGKSITYLSAHDASVVVWLAESFADEHRASLTWLNDHTDEGFEFWAVIPRLFKIGDSPPGLRFEVTIAPNVLVKEARKTERKMDEAVSATREAFWKVFMELVGQDPVLSQCGTRYGGRLGFIWLFQEGGGDPDAGEPHVVVFVSVSPPSLGYGTYCKEGAEAANEAVTDAAFQAALKRIAECGVSAGEVRGGYARLLGDLTTEDSMRALAAQGVERARVCMEVLSEALGAENGVV